MGKKLSIHYSEQGKGHCELHVDMKQEMFYIKYYDNNSKQFYVEDFPNKSLRYVEDAAENWTLGIKKLEGFE